LVVSQAVILRLPWNGQAVYRSSIRRKSSDISPAGSQ